MAEQPADLASLLIEPQLDVGLLSGAAQLELPLPLSPGRDGFGPSLSLSYASGAGNSPVGFGWGLGGLPSIVRGTQERLPTYREGADHFMCGGEELVPYLRQDGAGAWVPVSEDVGDSRVERYRCRREQAFERYERVVHRASGRAHWLHYSRNGIVSVFGRATDASTRIADPDSPDLRTFEWLIEAQYDPLGNAITFLYKPEDSAGVDVLSYESRRARSAALHTQRYLKSIRYGNSVPLSLAAPDAPANVWHFEVLFDYGEHGAAPPTYAEQNAWPIREDAFSTCRPQFEVRTRRRLRQILMFHRFAELGAAPRIINAVELTHASDPAGATISSVVHRDYRTDVGTDAITQFDRPPLTLTYTPVAPGTAFDLATETDHLPAGLDGDAYRWTDLMSEGLPGIFAQRGGAWYFKRNLGDGRFGPLSLVEERPVALSPTFRLRDVNGDGALDLAGYEGREAGFFSRNRESGRWSGYQPFSRQPRVDLPNARAQWMDLDGDGFDELVVDQDDRLTWYPSNGQAGFAAAVESSKLDRAAGGAPAVLAEPSSGVLLADMNGDGLPDVVEIAAGRVTYYPNLGSGHFGAAVVMDDPPMLADFGENDPARWRLLDTDGSGSADLLCIGDGEIVCWPNLSGNRFGAPRRLASLPTFDSLSSIEILDFLGDGSLCVVWSTPLPGYDTRAIQHLPLTQSTPPRLLQSVSNGAGRRTELTYRWSARDYLRDESAGNPWPGPIPRHAAVVARRELIDEVGGGRLVTRYEYHDGAFDDDARRFVGFARVDTFDADLPAAGEAEAVPPTLVRRWYHTGAVPESDRSSADAFAGDAQAAALRGPELVPLLKVSTEEHLDGYRALAGMPRREELYALGADGNPVGPPLRTEQWAYRVRQLAPGPSEHDACFAVEQVETLRHEYETDVADPVVRHEIVLDRDAYGETRLTASVAYPRRAGVGAAGPQQRALHVSVTESDALNVDTAARYELGVELEERDWVVHGLAAPVDGIFDRDALAAGVAAALAAPLGLLDLPPANQRCARITHWKRNVYWNGARTDSLPFRQAGPVTLVHHGAEAFLPDAAVGAALGGRVNAGMLTADGGYTLEDGHWWGRSGVSTYAGPEDFYRLIEQRTPQGEIQRFIFDDHRLFVLASEDAAGNRTEQVTDYQALAPSMTRDPNGNITETGFHPGGLPHVLTTRGQQLGEDGQPHAVGAEPLAAWIDRGPATAAQVLGDPARYLQNASELTVHYPGASANGPPCSIQLTRERHANDGEGNPTAQGPIRAQVFYFDGFGRTIQTKLRVAAGLAIQRDGAGAIVTAAGQPQLAAAADRFLSTGVLTFNNKGWMVRRAEPFFSPSFRFEADPVLRSLGAAVRFQYDGVGRVVRQDLPDGSVAMSRFSPWRSVQLDQNDAVVGSAWEAARAALPANDPARRALDLARAHADTPVIEELDPLGRTFLTREVGEGGVERTHLTELDDFGFAASVTDPRGVVTLSGRTDMLGRPLYERSADSGERWTFLDSAGRVAHRWDGLGSHERFRYDVLGRPQDVTVEEPGAAPRITRRTVYGDEAGVADADRRNARGRPVEQWDEAGRVVYLRYGPDGSPTEYRRDLVARFDQRPDWAVQGAADLAPNGYSVRTLFDALGRAVRQSLPDDTVRELAYAPQGHLAEIRVTTADGRFNRQVVVDDMEVGPRGERTRIRLGNGVQQSWEYDPASFRLNRLRAERGARRYLDVEYTYDAVGNVTRWIDQVQEPTAPAPLLQGAAVTSASEFTYDAFYQLRSATGRVHQLLELADEDAAPGRPGVLKGTRHLTLNNGAAVERYRRTYDYDPCGNLRQVAHTATSRAWTRDLWISPTSNRALPARDHNGVLLANPETWFDANGNATQMPHLRALVWDYANRLVRATVIDRSAAGQPDDAEFYAYDGDGVRIRRALQRMVQPGLVEVTETIYLGECEIRRVTRNGAPTLERLTSHFSDGTTRYATLHRWTRDDAAAEIDDPTASRIVYLLGNHLGSTVLELDQAGGIMSYEEYFPYGGTSFIAGDQARDVGIKEYRFQGKVRDDATGFVCFTFRYYVPWIGRWLNPDPGGPVDGANLYLFVHSNPVRFVDEDGLQAQGGGVEVSHVNELPDEINQKLAADPALMAEWNKGNIYFLPDANGGYQVLTKAQAEAWAQKQLESKKSVRFTLYSDAANDGGNDDGASGRLAAQQQASDIIDSLELDEIFRPLLESPLLGDQSGEEKKGGEQTGGDVTQGTAHPADGSSDEGAVEQAKTAETGSQGSGTTGSGPGAGNKGTGAGGPGAKGEADAGTPGTGGGTGTGTGKGAGSGKPNGGGTGTQDVAGAKDGVEGGVPEGVAGGTVGGTGTELKQTPSPNPNPTPDATPGAKTAPPGTPPQTGSTTGTAEPGKNPIASGSTGHDGRGKPGTDGAGGTRPDGVAGGTREGTRQTGEEGTQPKGDGKSGGGEPESALDTVTRWAGYLNFVFDKSEGGERGGIPGGLGLLGLKGKFWQVLFIVTTVVSTITMVYSIVKSISLAALRQGFTRLLAAVRSPLVALRGLATAARNFGGEAANAFRWLRGWVGRGRWSEFFRSGRWRGPGDFLKMMVRDARAWGSIQRWRDHVSFLFRPRWFGQSPFYNWEHIFPQALGANRPWLRPFLNSYANSFLRLPMQFNSSLQNRLLPKLVFYAGAVEANIRSWRLGKWLGNQVVEGANEGPAAAPAR